MVGMHPKWGNFGFDSGGECVVPMYYRFQMPDNGNAPWWCVCLLHLDFLLLFLSLLLPLFLLLLLLLVVLQ